MSLSNAKSVLQFYAGDCRLALIKERVSMMLSHFGATVIRGCYVRVSMLMIKEGRGAERKQIATHRVLALIAL